MVVWIRKCTKKRIGKRFRKGILNLKFKIFEIQNGVCGFKTLIFGMTITLSSGEDCEVSRDFLLCDFIRKLRAIIFVTINEDTLLYVLCPDLSINFKWLAYIHNCALSVFKIFEHFLYDYEKN